MSDESLREYIKKKIATEMSNNADSTKEGVLDSVFNHIQNVLKKSRDKKFNAAMEKLAKSSPDGKKAADHYYKSVDLIAKAAANKNYNKYD
tara:strand:- start:3630 stop:3902 length:273 start_codon:yes stop_codon:yes gene_type:complete